MSRICPNRPWRSSYWVPQRRDAVETGPFRYPALLVPLPLPLLCTHLSLGVSVTTDGTLFHTEPWSSHGHGVQSSDTAHAGRIPKHVRPVLLLLGIWLGLDSMNPIYYEMIKLLYTFPQSIGIAGRRPSSSYYFIGVQGNGLFYLDPTTHGPRSR
ncbi:hypothetical protein B0H11DRAFT_2225877 [Mycena galericulata]|nr:hypothetical protein B0H11DRAFT_2225877 [Mycena galericulata]